MTAASPLLVPWKGIFAAVLAAAAGVVTVFGTALPPADPPAGPTASAITERIAGAASARIVDRGEIDEVFAEFGLTGYDELIHDGLVSWWQASDGWGTILIAARTGTTDSASKGSALLVAELSGSDQRSITSPVDGRRGEYHDDDVDLDIVGWNVADAVLVVIADQTSDDRGTDFVQLVDGEVRAAGLSAPWLANSSRVVGDVVGRALLIVVVIAVGRALLRLRRRNVVDPSAADLDVSADADRLRWMGRAVATVQAAILVLVSVSFAAALFWFEYLDIAFVGMPLLSPLLLIIVAIPLSGLIRLVEGRSSYRLMRSWTGRLWAVAPLLGGVVVISSATLLVGMGTLSAAADNELFDRLDDPRFETARSVSFAVFLLTSVLAVCLYTLGAFLLRLASRLLAAAPRRGEWTPADQRSTLLLRSFGDDKLRVNTLPSGRQGLIRAWSFRASDRFEEVLAWELSDIGPVEAVAEPGGSPRSLGAARTLLDSENWEQEVWRRIHDVSNVVAVVADTPGFSWEVRALVRADALERTVFVMAPVSRRDAATRWWGLRNALALEWPETASRLPAQRDDLVAFRLGSEGAWTVSTKRRDEAGYRAAVRAAIEAGPQVAQRRRSVPGTACAGGDDAHVGERCESFAPPRADARVG